MVKNSKHQNPFHHTFDPWLQKPKPKEIEPEDLSSYRIEGIITTAMMANAVDAAYYNDEFYLRVYMGHQSR